MVVMSRETEDENTAAAVLFALRLIFRVPKISTAARSCGDTGSHLVRSDSCSHDIFRLGSLRASCERGLRGGRRRACTCLAASHPTPMMFRSEIL